MSLKTSPDALQEGKHRSHIPCLYCQRVGGSSRAGGCPCNESCSAMPWPQFHPRGLFLSLGAKTCATEPRRGPQGRLREQMLMRMLTELTQGCRFSNTYPGEMSTSCQGLNCRFHTELVQHDQVQDITEGFPNTWLRDHKIRANSPFNRSTST